MRRMHALQRAVLQARQVRSGAQGSVTQSLSPSAASTAAAFPLHVGILDCEFAFPKNKIEKKERESEKATAEARFGQLPLPALLLPLISFLPPFFTSQSPLPRHFQHCTPSSLSSLDCCVLLSAFLLRVAVCSPFSFFFSFTLCLTPFLLCDVFPPSLLLLLLLGSRRWSESPSECGGGVAA